MPLADFGACTVYCSDTNSQWTDRVRCCTGYLLCYGAVHAIKDIHAHSLTLPIKPHMDRERQAAGLYSVDVGHAERISGLQAAYCIAQFRDPRTPDRRASSTTSNY